MSRLPTDNDNVKSLGIYTFNGEVVAALGALLLTDPSGQKYAVLATGRYAATVLNQTFANQNSTGNTGNLQVGAYDELAVDFNVTLNGGTTPSLTFTISRLGADGVTLYPIFTTTAITASGKTSLNVGPGMTGTGAVPVSFAGIIQISWAITGTTPSFNFAISVVGK